MNISDIVILTIVGISIIAILVLRFALKISWKEIWRMMVEPFRSKKDYELETDISYITEINDICRDILGLQKYGDLCKLNNYEPLFYFWYSSGYPLVYITVNQTEENEKTQLENIILQTTKSYLTNYGRNYEATIEWGKNQYLGLPMMILGYARNEQENKAILRKKKEVLNRIINSSIGVIDDTEDLL